MGNEIKELKEALKVNNFIFLSESICEFNSYNNKYTYTYNDRLIFFYFSDCYIASIQGDEALSINSESKCIESYTLEDFIINIKNFINQ